MPADFAPDRRHEATPSPRLSISAIEDVTTSGQELVIVCDVCGRRTADVATMIDVSGTGEPSMVCQDPAACSDRAERQGQAPNLRYRVTVIGSDDQRESESDNLGLASYVSMIARFIDDTGADDWAMAEALAITRRPIEISIDIGASRHLEVASRVPSTSQANDFDSEE